MRKYLLLIFIIPLFYSCKKESKTPEIEPQIIPIIDSGLSEEELYDKILGMLVGSAIGDAMGAPTEMWSREAINSEYGFVEKLDSMIRQPSPEGTWLVDLPAGGTTDDTRWKALTVNYLLGQELYDLSASDFAKHILQQYEGYQSELNSTEETDSLSREKIDLKLNWLIEWAKVSQAYISKDVDAYADSLSRFYGGEMVCGGLLYAPTLGAVYPANPEIAYSESYKLSFFDIGYARDLTALTAAMTSAGMKKGATKNDLLAALTIDPKGYFKSRLVGRTAQKLLLDATEIYQKSYELDSSEFRLTAESEGLKFAFAALDEKNQDMPFHAGEIYFQVLTAMMYADFDFQGTMVFLVNYGRDNDTTAAVAGGILGAFVGFDQLPQESRELVLSVSKNLLNIDLEALAKELTNKVSQNKKP
ncbi:ADP-ribosylglycohydrolase family protein [Algoriphagus pacificus]|uniref:ADP-ribosylglycohydrolase family protein n=1 Tax=Algoriphagus pacificus TaxID=2811234 RepID=A0ABS3CLB0_9BACT|nr:ADP-ribosylglycohydrolase family protein [Algoriphagus pacificus]MBN7816429.1 ADP-ribosylglycohydrolase family protein [Algoriphagus pacificus]